MIAPTIDYRKGRIEIIDQTLLPGKMRVLRLRSLAELEEAISRLRVRGAPAIGLAAAYGMLIALEERLRRRVRPAPRYFFDRGSFVTPFLDRSLDARDLIRTLDAARRRIAATRPTAANLEWALDRVMHAARHGGRDPFEICCSAAAEAFWIHHEELEIERAIGRNGERIVRDGMNVLTHCNAGGLATAGYGTALGVLYAAWDKGKRFHVYVDETRPLLQGARLTAWELGERGIPHTLLCDGAAASLFAAGRVDAVVVGADRIAANGDTANKVGTLGLAVLCETFKRPFYVAAPASTFDGRIASGRDIPIEERSAAEVTTVRNIRLAPAGTRAYNPAFDVTPARLIRGIITERGIIERPDRKKIALFVKG